jgi:serine/threonine-protein kinase
MNSVLSRGNPAFTAYELTGQSSIDSGVRSEEGHHRFLDRVVVIRRLMPNGTGRAQRYYTFLQEIHAQAMLRHPSVAQVLDAGIYDEQPYAVIERPRGTTLEDHIAWLAEHGADVDTREAIRTIDALADMVEHAHSHSVRVHNLTPANIVLTHEGLPVLASLGSPELPDALRAAPRRLAFSAPELLSGSASDHRSDIYALGALLYYALTGRELSSDADALSTQQQVAGLPADIDTRALEMVIRKATARHISGRYASMRALRCDLAALLSGEELSLGQEEAHEPELLLAREFGAPTPMRVYQPAAPAALPAPMPKQQVRAAMEVADPGAVPGADREEFRAALPFTILVPMDQEEADTGVGAVARAGVFERLSWLSVILVVAIAVGTALMLG